MNKNFDIALVGGGLQNALIALAVVRHQPGARVVLFERGQRLGGNHLWCFHDGDLSPGMQQLVRPVVRRRFEHYDVHFPKLSRRLDQTYSAVSSEDLAAHLKPLFDVAHRTLHLGCEVTQVGESSVTLSNGSRIEADLVVDARGPQLLESVQASGYQKFVGLELQLDRDADVDAPILMDARVPQIDGFRFMYVLPFEPRRILIEDTYFSDSRHLDVDQVRNEVLRYAVRRGLSPKAIVREEQGVLPLPLRTQAPQPSVRPLIAGYQGGWFHPTTGYSFPLAARLAEHAATRPAARILDDAFRALVRDQGRQLRFSCFLNRLLFRGFRPEDRWGVLQRFYGLNPETIRRFYAHRTTAIDRTRILCGRPPRGMSVSSVITGGPPQ
ncbi:MAG TPA: lycopene beta-cyclase CrtY [Polyangiaceae bacterium]|nr:lycopene beta-cyclase CrtY [Polyangiaceae bacterium]